MGLVLAALTAAFATNVYINGVKATGLKGFELQDVNVTIDAKGDVYIDAPRYSIEVMAPPDPADSVPAPATDVGPAPAATEPVSTAEPDPTVAPTPEPAVETEPAPATAAVTPVTPVTAPPEPLVAPESWWLVTEDNASAGHVVEVFIGGTAVATVRSGDDQLILDVSPYLAPGDNIVNVSAQPADALGGGVLKLYLGPGSNDAGTLNLAAPQLTFTRRATDDVAGTSEQRTLVVD